MAGGPGDDGLSATLPDESDAHTATPQIGRYRIDRRVGAGGMGVVYAAFDPDLERRVALKILQSTGSELARQRLLREARALARVTHPSVPAIYEVGSAGAIDFIAMELVDGEPLHEWLRGGPRSQREIVEAFLAAGHGLAAAHAAGVVHRDFKPHNVLRTQAGRIVVVDFGLAREATEGAPKPASRDTPTELTGLTVPGSLLGTPAYMAPEQWTGDPVTPATDQFSFCVALWEALAGERPYLAPTGEGLREQVTGGEPDGDVTKLPRRLRSILQRGLARSPGDRWPSMNAVLARLSRRRRVGAIAIAVAAVAVAAAGSALVMHRSAAPTGPACTRPVIAVAPIEATVQSLREGGNTLAAWQLDHDLASWRLARIEACAVPVASRPRRLACLDHVLARTDAVRQVSGLDPAVQLGDELLDPRACLRDEPPQLPDHYSDGAVRALAVRARSSRVNAADLDKDSDPCVQSYLALAKGTEVSRALHAAQLCGDDDAFAEASLSIDVSAPGYASAIADARDAAARAGQPRLIARLHGLVAEYLDVVEDDLDGAAEELERANDHQPDAVASLAIEVRRLSDLVVGGRVPDLETVHDEIAAWRPLAVFSGHAVDALDRIDTMVRWFAGDVAGTHAHLVDLYRRTGRSAGGRTVVGHVVDAAGAPVAGVLVAGSLGVNWDALGINPGLLGQFPSDASLATSGPDGAFAILVPDGGWVVAERGDQRSRVVKVSGQPIELRLEPTAKITGRVRGVRPQDGLLVSVRGDETGFAEVAPVAADGSFELGMLRPGHFYVTASTNGMRNFGTSQVLAPLDVPAAGIRDFVADLRPVHRVDVIVRSASLTPLEYAMVVVAAGTPPITTLREIYGLHRGAFAILTARPTRRGATAETLAQMQPDDTLAAFPAAPAGDASVCALGVPVAKGADAAVVRERIARSYESAPMHCQPLPAGATSAVLTVPPI